ncbi:MAG: hypothetical protein H9535_10835 [Ignavibacteria bacterium]|nr:hypothetical protein [Ignavibacteria bacterium]
MRLDGKHIVFNETIIALDGQRVEFDVPVLNSQIPFAIIFSVEPESKTGIRSSLGNEDNRLIIEAINWTNSLGIALKETVVLGEYRDKNGKDTFSIHCLMASHKIGVTNVASLQILLETLS